MKRLKVDLEDIVYSKKAKGTILTIVTLNINANMSKYRLKDYLCGWRFVEVMLKELMNEFKIYVAYDE